MRLLRSARTMQRLACQLRQHRRRIGVVPTMGALHEGHASLIRAAAKEAEVVIVTIFVNPLQFGPREDFRRYPRTLAEDLCLARAAGADIVFAPNVDEIYPRGFQSAIEVGSLAQHWEGERRPGHFRGVATVVAILCELTQPTDIYVGQKDYQQALIIQRLVEDLRLPLRVHVRPTMREADGLAMSSRNAYLSPGERAQASVLYRALCAARSRIRSGGRRAQPLIKEMRRVIARAKDARIDYLAIVDARTLEPQPRLRGRIALLVAVRIGRTRLIDNFLVDVP